MASDSRAPYAEICQCEPGPGINLDKGVKSSLYGGCKCSGQCDYDGIQTEAVKCGCSCPYDKDGCLHSLYFEEFSVPIIECNSRCTCDLTCRNRRSQHGSCQYLSLFNTESKGLGLVSTVNLPMGFFVGEYVGEIISKLQADVRLISLTDESKCYLLQFQEHLNNRTLITNIDATFKGNLTRFINHSCDPNLVIVPVRTETIVPRLCLFTCKCVCIEEELCFSYFGGDISTKLGSKNCLCKSENCVGFLPLNKYPPS